MSLKLITEFIDFHDCEILTEQNENHEKIYRIKGPFLQAEVKNRNGRRYAHPILEREVSKFNNEKILRKRAFGELDHPPTPSINLDRVSHIIESLDSDGSNSWIGVAKLIDTPSGKIAQVLVKEGCLLGVSSRGVGSLNGERVNDDYNMVTVDIVADPSAPDAFVNGILENKEFIIEGSKYVEYAVNRLKEQVDKKYNSKVVLQYMLEFIEAIH